MHISKLMIGTVRSSMQQCQTEPLSEILPGDMKTDTRLPSFYGPCQNLYSWLI